ncbi:hypothetical protein BH11VER1_BH11VER1_28390 [soil metagenome]
MAKNAPQLAPWDQNQEDIEEEVRNEDVAHRGRSVQEPVLPVRFATDQFK